jgi:hypothetical protein
MKAVLSNMKNWLCIIYFLLTPFFALANPFTWEEQVDTVSKQQVGFSYLSDTIKSSVEKKDYKTIFAIKSNLLYDLATMVNVSVEVPFVIQDNHFSVVAQHQFPWWLWGDNKYCFRFLSSGGELRWWFKPHFRPESEKRLKRDALVGHFIGLYGLGGKYDFQNKQKYCYQGEFWSTGLVYGYAMSIAKRVNLEFTVALGYASIPYRHYIPSNDYEILYRDPNKTGIWHYVGPTRVEVSLSIPIYKEKKKGGRR